MKNKDKLPKHARPSTDQGESGGAHQTGRQQELLDRSRVEEEGPGLQVEEPRTGDIAGQAEVETVPEEEGTVQVRGLLRRVLRQDRHAPALCPSPQRRGY